VLFRRNDKPEPEPETGILVRFRSRACATVGTLSFINRYSYKYVIYSTPIQNSRTSISNQKNPLGMNHARLIFCAFGGVAAPHRHNNRNKTVVHGSSSAKILRMLTEPANQSSSIFESRLSMMRLTLVGVASKKGQTQLWEPQSHNLVLCVINSGFDFCGIRTRFTCIGMIR
jgi:hypothetical protein